MKIAIIGGAGVRTPLLVNGLAESDLPIDEIALFDTDGERLALIAGVARAFASCVRTYADVVPCVSGASFVILSIRAGGIAARAHDEAIAVEHGVVGQETVGAAGFAMAMRNVPPAVEYARLIERHAPSAWIVNFTNPVGIVTQAITTVTAARVVGICDTPTELFEAVAAVLGVESSRCEFDYFGLNHLGWLREVRVDGTPELARIWSNPALLDRVYRAPLFDRSFLEALRLLPTEYLFYYYSPDRALANTRHASHTRGQAIASLNDRLFRDLGAVDADPRRIYDAYLRSRNAGYMQIESGSAAGIASPSWADLTGYDKIALQVIRAMHMDSNATLPVNVVNAGAIADLRADDVVEIPCIVNATGAHPRTVGAVPDSVRDLIVRVKEYERMTIAAAASRTIDDAVRALAHNPLVADATLARRLAGALRLDSQDG